MTRNAAPVSATAIRRVLRDTFGLAELRDGQEPVIERVLHGLPTLAVMPTGAGKSLCYQLPAMLVDGRTLVVSPLIALMKDQCDHLCGAGVAAVQWHSGVDATERRAAEQAIADGSARIVFITPEQLTRPEFVATISERPVALLVIDEAHCIAQWGFDFRPAFLEVGTALEALRRPTVLALTATATDPVIDDITEVLGIPRAGVLGTGMFRPNLRYRAENFSRPEDKLARLIERVHASEGSGLVYAATVKAAEELHEAIIASGEPAGLYHGKLNAVRRREAQDAFMSGTVRVMVATNAFGLGIDKPDIRFVLHWQIPAGLDAYYQESGRAGRDGAPSDCTLLFVEGDRSVQRFFISGRYPELDDFRAVVEGLRKPAPDASGWTLDALVEHEHLNKRKAAVALNVMRRERLLVADRRGALALRAGGVGNAALEPLVERCHARGERDRAMLEQMVAYAQSGRCRWQLLLEHLEAAAPRERCGSCDNCVRMAGHEAAHAPTATGEGADGPIVFPKRESAFGVGQRVKTRRHGLAEVVSADTLSVTVRFANGETRSFQPQFLTPVKGPRRGPPAESPPAVGAASNMIGAHA